MDLFEEISKTKSDFPKIKSIKKEFSGKKLNLYQIFSIGLFVVFFFLGIIFGNLFSTCKASSYYFSDTCLVNEFNDKLYGIASTFVTDISINTDGAIILGVINYPDFATFENTLKNSLNAYIEQEKITNYFYSYKGANNVIKFYICVIFEG